MKKIKMIHPIEGNSLTLEKVKHLAHGRKVMIMKIRLKFLILLVILVMGCIQQEGQEPREKTTEIHDFCATPFKFEESVGVAVDNETYIYNVAYYKIQKLKKCDSGFGLVWERGFMSDDVDVAVDNGYVWLVSRSHNAIGKFSSDGQSVSFNIKDIESPNGIAVKNNYVYVNEFSNYVKKYDAETGGSPVLVISLPFEINKDIYLEDVAVDSMDNLYVLLFWFEPNPDAPFFKTYRVFKFDKEGNLIDREFITDIVHSESITISSTNDIIISDYSGDPSTRIDMIKKYSSDGKLISKYVVPGSNYISGVTIGADSKIYVSDSYANKIFILPSNVLGNEN